MKIVCKTYEDNSGNYILYHRENNMSFRHRENGPAFEHISGPYKGEISYWYYNQRHSFDGKPARTLATNGETKAYEWYDMGNRHRVKGPASIIISVSSSWYKHHLRHRLNAPAFISDYKEHWEFGMLIKQVY